MPLEALRLGCEAYANDLNPVAHIIQLCTLLFPQKYGQPEPADELFDQRWQGLSSEVLHWGHWVLDKVKAEIGDLYPLIPDSSRKRQAFRGQWKPATRARRRATRLSRTGRVSVDANGALQESGLQSDRSAGQADLDVQEAGTLCRAETNGTEGREKSPIRGRESATQEGLGFDPEAGSKAGNATCPFCGTVADSEYVKAEGHAGRLAIQAMAVATAGAPRMGKRYFPIGDKANLLTHETKIRERIDSPVRGNRVDGS